jgi:hypothetical protein
MFQKRDSNPRSAIARDVYSVVPLPLGHSGSMMPDERFERSLYGV